MPDPDVSISLVNTNSRELLLACLESLQGVDAEIVVVLSGTDEGNGQTILARWAYRPTDIRRNARFVDIIGVLPDGTRTIDYGRFHEVQNMDAGGWATGH